MQIMRTMMPVMLSDMEPEQMEELMNTMIPMMMQIITEKGVDGPAMMEMMCPACFSHAIEHTGEDEKAKMKTQLLKTIENMSI
jgi:hypothetical protein